jgi:hypothetical protein
MKALIKLLTSISKISLIEKMLLLKMIKNKSYGKNMKISNKIKKAELKNLEMNKKNKSEKQNS